MIETLLQPSTLTVLADAKWDIYTLSYSSLDSQRPWSVRLRNSYFQLTNSHYGSTPDAAVELALVEARAIVPPVYRASDPNVRRVPRPSLDQLLDF